MTTVFLDAFFKPFFTIVHDASQKLTIDRTNFLTDVFLQIIQRTGVCERKHAISNTPQTKKKKITRWKIGRARGPRHVSERGNEVPGKYISNNGRWLVCSVRCDCIATEVANPEEKNADHLSPPPLGPTYWVLPIQKMSGSRGSLCIYIYIYRVFHDFRA